MTAESPASTNQNTFLLPEFLNQVDTYKTLLHSVEKKHALKDAILKDFSHLSNSFIALGNALENSSLESDANSSDTYLINYRISDKFKDVIILHRDVLLELHKVDVLLIEDKDFGAKEQHHFQSSKDILIAQLEDFQLRIAEEQKSVNYNPKVKKAIGRKLSLIQNPWPVYRTQFETLLQQFHTIEKGTKQLIDTLDKFEKLKAVSAIILKNYETLNVQLENNLTHINKSIIKDETGEELSFFIDEQIAHVVTLGNNQQELTSALNSQIDQLKPVKIPIATQEGLLVLREIDLNKAVQKWFDYQIVPEIMDVLAIENSLKSLNGIGLTNLKNNLKISQNAGNTEENTRLKPDLSSLKNGLAELKIKGARIVNRIDKKIKAELQIHNLLKEKSFLEVPFNTSLNLDSSTIVAKIKKPLMQSLYFFDEQIKKTTNYQEASDIEMATHCLHHRMFKQDDEHYDSLFLNKQFIGDLFLVPRVLQEKALQTTIEQWHMGFNKSALVHGERLSGRSTFLDYTSKKYFGKDTVTLKPNSVATIDGRKFTTTTNLKQALQYIKNNNIESTKPVIIIDDLELWRDSEFSFLSNVRALINFIETESDDTFVIASTTTLMVKQLDARLAFSNAFSTTLDVTKTDKEGILQALLIRHGAAHRILVAENLEPLTEKTIQKLIVKLSGQYHNNLGDVLQAWTYHTFVQENEMVMFKEEEFVFPDFFTQQEMVILKQAAIFRMVTEFGLKRVTASGFESEFKSAIKRLINTKVLLRNTLGHLYINPVILNDVNLFINQRN